MKPRPPHARGWWVILDGTTPTAFRARTRETLVPTLFQLQRTQPAVVLKWVERGRVWASPAEARDAAFAARPRPKKAGAARPRGWRPGGQHRDPRERFSLTRDQRRARFKARRRRPVGRDKGPK